MSAQFRVEEARFLHATCQISWKIPDNAQIRSQLAAILSFTERAISFGYVHVVIGKMSMTMFSLPLLGLTAPLAIAGFYLAFRWRNERAAERDETIVFHRAIWRRASKRQVFSLI